MQKSTTAKLSLMCPTYKRPKDLQLLTDNIRQNTKNSYVLYFGLEQDDKAGIKAARDTGAEVIINRYEPGGYSNTIQNIYENSREPFCLHLNDDFEFHKDWDEVPLSMFDREDLMVVGLKQTEGDFHGSSISIFRRRYIKEQSGVIDMPNRVFYPYNHNYADSEFTQTAQFRNVWALCDLRVITHMHPGFTGKDKDATFIKNEATVNLDQATFETRKHLWGQ